MNESDELFRHYPVGVSVEQLALGWLRVEGAPHGAVVVVDHEIGGRQRLGIPWRAPAAESFSCAVVLRPSLLAEREALLWIAGLVAAATLLSSSSEVRTGWPDLLFDSASREVGSVALDVQFGPGVVEAAVVALRLNRSLVALRSESDESIARRFVAQLLRSVDMAREETDALLHEYHESSLLIGSRVRARLLPKGEARGTATAVDASGALLVTSSTGMVERLNPVSVLRVDRV